MSSATSSGAGLELVTGVRSVQRTADGVRVVIDDRSVIPDGVETLVRSGVRISRVLPREPSLEELYFAVRQTARDLVGRPRSMETVR